jgi:hypothetical protein
MVTTEATAAAVADHTFFVGALEAIVVKEAEDFIATAKTDLHVCMTSLRGSRSNGS